MTGQGAQVASYTKLDLIENDQPERDEQSCDPLRLKFFRVRAGNGVKSKKFAQLAHYNLGFGRDARSMWVRILAWRVLIDACFGGIGLFSGAAPSKRAPLEDEE